MFLPRIPRSSNLRSGHCSSAAAHGVALFVLALSGALPGCGAGDPATEESSFALSTLPPSSAPIMLPPDPSDLDERQPGAHCSGLQICGLEVITGTTTECPFGACKTRPNPVARELFRVTAPKPVLFASLYPSTRGSCHATITNDGSPITHDPRSRGAVLNEYFEDGSSAALTVGAPYDSQCNPSTELATGSGDTSATRDFFSGDRRVHREARMLSLHVCGCAPPDWIRRAELQTIDPCGNSSASGPQAGDPVDLETHGLHEKLECFSFGGKGREVHFGLGYDSRSAERRSSSYTLGTPGWGHSYSQSLFYVPAATDDAGSKARFLLSTPDGQTFELAYASFDSNKGAYVFRQSGGSGVHSAFVEVMGPVGGAFTGDLSDIDAASELHLVQSNGVLDRFALVRDGQGKLLAGTLYEEIDRLGARTVLHYEPPPADADPNLPLVEGRLIGVDQISSTGATGSRLRLAYATTGDTERLATVSELGADGNPTREVRFGYDGDGQLQTVEGPAFVGKPGRRFTFAYDDAGFLSRLWEPLQAPAIAGGVATAAGTKFTETTYATSALGARTGEVLQQTFGTEQLKDVRTTFAWNLPGAASSGFDTSITESALSNGKVTSHVTNLAHDASGHVARFYTPFVPPAKPSTTFSTFTYDTASASPTYGLLLADVDASGVKTTYEYDLARRSLGKVTVDPGGANLVTLLATNDYGQTTSVKGPDGVTTSYVYTQFPHPRYPGDLVVGSILQKVQRTGTDGSVIVDAQYQISPNGLPTVVTLADGTKVHYYYDDDTAACPNGSGLGLLCKTVYDEGKLAITELQTWNRSGFLTSSTDRRGVTTTFEYDPSAPAAALGYPTAIVHDAAGSSDTSQQRSELTRDIIGQLLVVDEDATGPAPLHRRTERRYERFGAAGSYEIVGMTAAAGTPYAATSTFEFSPWNELLAAVDPAGRYDLYSYAYDVGGAGRTTTTRTRPGCGSGMAPCTWTAFSDATGRPASAQDPMSADRVVTFDSAGRPATVRRGTQPVRNVGQQAGAPADFGAANVVMRTVFGGASDGASGVAGSQIGKPVRSFVADATGAAPLSGGEQVAQSYDAFGRVAGTVLGGPGTALAKPFVTRYTYDNRDRVVSTVTTAPSGQGFQSTTLSFAYDAVGRLTAQTVDPGGLNLVSQTAYRDGTKSDWLPLVLTDARGNVTHRQYNSRGQLTSVLDATGNRFSYTHDRLGRTIEASGAGRDQTFAYDLLGRTTSVTSHGQTESWTYGRDGTVATHTALGGAPSEAFFYDLDGRLCRIDRAPLAGSGCTGADSSDDARFDYYDDGKLRAVTDFAVDAGGTKTTYAYDALQRLVTRTRSAQGAARTVAYHYRPNDTALAQVDYFDTNASVRYQTDSGRVTGLGAFGGKQVGFAWDGSVVSTIGVDPVVTHVQYDAAGRRTRQRSALGPTSFLGGGSAVFDLGRDLDRNGNPLAWHERWLGESALDHTFAYDALDRITTIRQPALSAAGWNANVPAIDVANAYDGAGNATSFLGQAQSFDAADQVTGATYDARGSLLGQDASYAYDSANRLRQITQSGKTVTFHYDGLGQLVQRCEPGGCTDFVLDESGAEARIVAELGDATATGAAKRTLYAYGPEGLAVVRSPDGTNRVAVADDLGSVRALVAFDGSLEARYAYTAYGDLRAATGGTGIANNLGFTGEYSGPGDGVEWLRARAYSPSRGRFLQRDELPGVAADPATLNRYSYANNRPTVLTDPSGNCPWCVPVLIGAAIPLALDLFAPRASLAPEKVNAFDPCAGNRQYPQSPFEQALKQGTEQTLALLGIATLGRAALDSLPRTGRLPVGTGAPRGPAGLTPSTEPYTTPLQRFRNPRPSVSGQVPHPDFEGGNPGPNNQFDAHDQLHARYPNEPNYKLQPNDVIDITMEHLSRNPYATRESLQASVGSSLNPQSPYSTISESITPRQLQDAIDEGLMHARVQGKVNGMAPDQFADAHAQNRQLSPEFDRRRAVPLPPDLRIQRIPGSYPSDWPDLWDGTP